MTSVRRILLVAPILAALGTALAPAAQARDGRNGALAVGALLGLGAAAVASGALGASPGGVADYEAPPPIGYAPAPVYASPPMAYVPVPVYEAPPPVAYARPPMAYAPPPVYAMPRRSYEGQWVSYGRRHWHGEDDDD